MDDFNKIIFNLKGYGYLATIFPRTQTKRKSPYYMGAMQLTPFTKIRLPKLVKQETERGQSKEVANTRARRERKIEKKIQKGKNNGESHERK